MAGKNERIKPYPLGVYREDNGLRASFVSKMENCGLILYRKEDGSELRKIPFAPEDRLGNIHYGWIPDVDADDVTYQFYEGDHVVADAYGRVFEKQEDYGIRREEKDLRAGFLKTDYDWQEDERPQIPYEECICYLLHVRGFTKHPSSKVPHKGTFRGVIEKIPYLKELGITTIELQPAYEFIESEEGREKLNYWGYQKGFYYAPKAAYAAGEDPTVEFCDMVRALHENRIEVVMQFYFPKEASSLDITDILRFWVLQYHVDGFRLIGEQLPLNLIAADPGLADTKLWLDTVDENWIDNSFDRARGTDAKKEQPYRNLAVYRDDYLNDMRRFLKGDQDMLQSACFQMRRNGTAYGKINFFSNYYGFTMMDMVSYNDKHNEDNGESNRDGCCFNQSWNCGTEGQTRKKQVMDLRIKQYKNAMSMLFLSQGTPLLFMGDEFGNSQKGNNNPYCQDNEVSWLNWRDLHKHKELYDFTAGMISLRKAHPVMHLPREPRGIDYSSMCYPELSYHGTEAYRPSMESQDRKVGIMYCGKDGENGQKEDFLYLAFNMHWEEGTLAMPKLPKNLEWELQFMTGEEGQEQIREKTGNSIQTCIPPRTVAIFIGRERTEHNE